MSLDWISEPIAYRIRAEMDPRTVADLLAAWRPGLVGADDGSGARIHYTLSRLGLRRYQVAAWSQVSLDRSCDRLQDALHLLGEPRRLPPEFLLEYQEGDAFVRWLLYPTREA